MAEATKKKDVAVLQSRYLKYGDTILLLLDGKNGYISASEYLAPQLRVEDMKDGVVVPPDIKICLFVVMQKHQYTQKTAFLNQLIKAGFTEENLSEWSNTSTYEPRPFTEVKNKNLRMQLQLLEQNYIRELAVNAEEYQQSIGEYVMYGQAVQLKHLVSGKMVTIKKTAADVERGALKVVLDEIGSQGSWFNVHSGYRTKPEGSKVMMDDIIALKSAGFNGMALHVSSSPIQEQSMLPVDLHHLVEQNLEVSASPDPATLKIVPHSIHPTLEPKAATQVCGLSCVAIQDLVANSVYINVLTWDQGRVFWESPLSRVSTAAQAGTDVWRLEPVKVHWCGRPITNGSHVRFRHIISGMYLHLDKIKAHNAMKTLGKGASLDMIDHADLKLALSTDFSSSGTVWELVLFSKDDNAMSQKAYAFWKHVDTGLWLSGAGSKLENLEGEEASEGVERVHAVGHPQQLERNVVVVTAVDAPFIVKVERITRCLRIMGFFKNELAKVQLESEEELLAMDVANTTVKLQNSGLKAVYMMAWSKVARMFKFLEQMFDYEQWVNSEETDAPAVYQALARESRLLDMIIDSLVLARITAVDASPPVRTSTLGRWSAKFGLLAHHCLQLCCVKNEANQAYISRWSNIVMRHLSTPAKAADTLAALYEGNMTQMQSVTQDIIVASVDLIRKYGHNARFINFLIQLCGPKERPIPINQNWLVQEIISSGDPLHIIFAGGLHPRPASHGSMTWIFYATSMTGRRFAIDCAEFKDASDDSQKKDIWDWDTGDNSAGGDGMGGDDGVVSPTSASDPDVQERRGLFVFYVAALTLLVSFCYGRNGLARNTLLQASEKHKLGLEYKTLHEAVRHPDLPYVLRSLFAQLLSALYVDVEPYQPVKLPRLVRLLPPSSSVDPRAAEVSVRPDENVAELIQTVQDLLSVCLEEGKAVNVNTDDAVATGVNTVGRNTFVCMLLRLVRDFFRLGLLPVSESHAESVLVLLLKLLHELDCLPLDNKARFKLDNTTSQVMEAKRIAMQALEMALDQQTEEQILGVFSVFTDWERKHGSLSTYKAGTRGGAEDKWDGPALAGKAGFNNMDAAVSSAVEALRAADKHEIGLFRFNAAGRGLQVADRETSILSSMLELVRYREPVLASKVYQLLERLVSKRSAVITGLVRTFVVTDTSLILVSRRVQELLLGALQHYNYMASLDKQERDTACAGAIDCISSLTDLLRPLTHVEFTLHGESQKESIFISKGLASNIQFLMNDLGVHEVALKFLKLPLNRKPQSDRRQLQEAEDELRRDVMAECLTLISEFMVIGNEKTAICIPNTMNQAVVLPNLQLFVSFLNVRNLPVSDAISSFFERNVEIATKEGPTVLKRFVKMIVQYGKKQQARWLALLRRLLIVDGQPIKANQSTVIKLASQYESEFLLLFNEEGALDKLHDLMVAATLKAKAKKKRSSSEESGGSEMAYHINCVKLLADCCDGKEPEMIVKASGYLSLQQVVDTLLYITSHGTGAVSGEVTRDVARAYWKFLRLVYFSTDTENTRLQVRIPANKIWPAKGEMDAALSRTKTGMSTAMARFLSVEGEAASKTEHPQPQIPKPPVHGGSSLGSSSHIPPHLQVRSPDSPQSHAESVLGPAELPLPSPADDHRLRDPDRQSSKRTRATLLNPPLPSREQDRESHQSVGILSPGDAPIGFSEGFTQGGEPEDLPISPNASASLDNTHSKASESRPKSAKSDHSRSKSPKSESSRSKSPRPESSSPKSPRPESSRSKSPRPESSSPKSPRPESSRSKSPRPESSRSKSPKSGGSRPSSALAPSMPPPPPAPMPPPPAPSPWDMMTKSKSKAATEEPARSHASCLIEVALDNLENALAEPRGALSSLESASYFIAYDVVPALSEYFEKHYNYHQLKLPDTHVQLLKMLQQKVVAYMQGIKSLEGTEMAAQTKDQRKQALVASRKLLGLLNSHSPLESAAALLLGKSVKAASSAGSGSVAIKVQKGVHKEWDKFCKGIASTIAVVIDDVTNEVVELRYGGDGTLLKYCSTFLLARLLTPKHLATISCAVPQMYHEEAVKRLCDLFVALPAPVMEWPLEVTVKTIRLLRGIVAIDDGNASTEAWQRGWQELGWLLDADTGEVLEEEAREFDPNSEEAEKLMQWRQSKYHLLRMSMAAVKLLSHPKREVQFEALQLLSALLQDGNKEVQDAVCQQLSGSADWVAQVFQNLHTSFERCTKYMMKGVKKMVRPEERRAKGAVYAGTEASKGVLEKGMEAVAGELTGAGKTRAAPSSAPEERPAKRQKSVMKKDVAKGRRDSMLSVIKEEDGEGGADGEGDETGKAAAPEEDEDEEEAWTLKPPILNDSANPLAFSRAVLVCLKQMCEGHHTDLQALVQVQPGSSSSVDLLTESVDLLSVLQDNIQEAIIYGMEEVSGLMVQVFETLSEMIQGPATQNQTTLVATNFLVTCNRIFGYVEYSEDPALERPSMAAVKCELKTRLLELLKSLLEGMQDEDIPIRCKEIIDWAAIDRQIERLWKMVSTDFYEDAKVDLEDQEPEMLKELKDALVEEMLQMCCFVMKVNSASPSRAPVLPYIMGLYKTVQNPDSWPDDLPADKKAIAAEFQVFLQSHIGYVEVNWKGRLEPEYFVPPKECWAMMGSSVWCNRNTEKLQQAVSADSRAFPAMKASELVEAMGEKLWEVELEELLSRNKWMRWVQPLLKLRLFLLEVTFFLAILMLAFMVLTNDVYTSDPDFSERLDVDDDLLWKPRLLIFLNVLQLVSTFLLTMLFIMYDLTNQVRKKMYEWAEEDANRNKGKEKGMEYPLGLPPPPILESNATNKLLILTGRLTLLVLTFWKLWYILMLMAASILALLISPFFMVLHFSIYFLDFESGQILVEAMMRSGFSILSTFVMAVLLIFTCATITFNIFPGVMGDDTGPPPCDTFYECMGTHMLSGIYGDIAPLFQSTIFSNVPTDVNIDMGVQARSLFILVFHMLWNYVVINIFIGLINSAFCSIQEDKSTIETDSQSTCFMCSLDMYTLDDKTIGGFEDHVRHDHNVNNYVFFLYHIFKKPESERSGVESAVNNVIINATTATEKGFWLPVSKALALKKDSS